MIDSLVSVDLFISVSVLQITKATKRPIICNCYRTVNHKYQVLFQSDKIPSLNNKPE